MGGFGFDFACGVRQGVGAPKQELPPAAGDFCYGKSHQNHVRRTAAAARYPARLARQAPRRTRAIPGPRTNGACSPVGLRCSAAFKARQVKNSMFLPVVCVALRAEQRICAIRLLLCRLLLKSKSQDQKLPPSAGDFCYGKSHQNHLRRTAAAARFPARLTRQAPRRTRAIPGPRTIGACSPVGLRCSAALKARVSQKRRTSTAKYVAINHGKQRICAVRAFAFPCAIKHAERRRMARGKGPHVRAHGCASSDRPAPCQPRRASARSADVRQARMVLPTFAVTKVGHPRQKLLLLAAAGRQTHFPFP